MQCPLGSRSPTVHMRYSVLHERKLNVYMTEPDIRSLYFVSVEGCSRPSVIDAFKSGSLKALTLYLFPQAWHSVSLMPSTQPDRHRPPSSSESQSLIGLRVLPSPTHSPLITSTTDLLRNTCNLVFVRCSLFLLEGFRCWTLFRRHPFGVFKS